MNKDFVIKKPSTVDLFNNPNNLKILKLCSHLCFEFHADESSISYKNIIDILIKNFSNSHKILQTYYLLHNNVLNKGPYAVFILIKNDIYYDNSNNIKDIIEKNRIEPNYLNKTSNNKNHKIKYFN